MLTETGLGAMRVRMLSRDIHKRDLCYLLSIGDDGNTIVIKVRMKGSDSSSYNWWLPAST